MTKTDGKKQFTELYYFPEKYLEKELIIEGFYGGGDRLNESDMAEFQQFGLNYRDYMIFTLYDREKHDFMYLCCPQALSPKIAELEDGQALAVQVKVIAVGTDIDPREPVLLVRDMTPGDEIFKLDLEDLDDEEDDEEDDYWDEIDSDDEDELESDDSDDEDEYEDEPGDEDDKHHKN